MELFRRRFFLDEQSSLCRYAPLEQLRQLFLLPSVFQLTSTATEPSLGFTVVSCFVSPNSNPSAASDYMLIENVCPKDDSVVLHSQKDFLTGGHGGRRKTFSFHFNSKLNKSLLFLHCEVSLCARRLHHSQSLPPVRSSFHSRLGLFLLFPSP